MALQDLKDAKKEELCRAYKKELNGLVSLTVNGKTLSFVNGDKEKRNKENALEYMERNSMSSGRCAVYGGTYVVLTIQEWRDLIVAWSDFGAGLFDKKWNLLDSVDSATTETAVNNINW